MLKFNPGDSTALYSSVDKDILILKCRAPTSAHLEDLKRHEEIWARSKGVSLPAHNFGELWSKIATFCALLFTLFGEGCDLYKSISKIL